MEKVTYAGWPNCIRLTNGTVELVATTDVGPRIIRYGFVGQQNELFEEKDQLGQTGSDKWLAYGGHRFWIAPESTAFTYYPDNAPVEHSWDGSMLSLISETERTGFQKEVHVAMSPSGSHVKMVHKIINHSAPTTQLAPWCLTVMAGGGRAIFPQEQFVPHQKSPDAGVPVDEKYYLPVRNLSLWSYTRLDDPRWIFTSKYLVVKQDPNATIQQKIGMSNKQNWEAYARDKHLFVKKVIYQEGAEYPDNGCIFETYTDPNMLELESLGPLVTLRPGETVTHQEDWYLFDGIEFENTDESIDSNVLPTIQSVL